MVYKIFVTFIQEEIFLIDHSECCKTRDIPEECSDICSGHKLESLDFSHFKCVEFMPEITNCMLSSYNVLPGQPKKFKFSNVGTNIGILHWNEPFEHHETIDGYR